MKHPIGHGVDRDTVTGPSQFNETTCCCLNRFTMLDGTATHIEHYRKIECRIPILDRPHTLSLALLGYTEIFGSQPRYWMPLRVTDRDC